MADEKAKEQAAQIDAATGEGGQVRANEIDRIVNGPPDEVRRHPRGRTGVSRTPKWNDMTKKTGEEGESAYGAPTDSVPEPAPRADTRVVKKDPLAPKKE